MTPVQPGVKVDHAWPLSCFDLPDLAKFLLQRPIFACRLLLAAKLREVILTEFMVYLPLSRRRTECPSGVSLWSQYRPSGHRNPGRHSLYRQALLKVGTAQFFELPLYYVY